MRDKVRIRGWLGHALYKAIDLKTTLEVGNIFSCFDAPYLVALYAQM